MKDFFPGTRVRVFDSRLYVNDRETPLSTTMREATVVRWYGKQVPAIDKPGVWRYPSLIDVQFDHDPSGRISCGHFAEDLEWRQALHFLERGLT